MPPYLTPGSSALIQLSHQTRGSRDQCGWNLPPEMLQKLVLEKGSATLRELENQAYYPGGPRGVNTPSSEPQTKGYRVFIHGQA